MQLIIVLSPIEISKYFELDTNIVDNSIHNKYPGSGDCFPIRREPDVPEFNHVSLERHQIDSYLVNHILILHSQVLQTWSYLLHLLKAWNLFMYEPHTTFHLKSAHFSGVKSPSLTIGSLLGNNCSTCAKHDGTMCKPASLPCLCLQLFGLVIK